MRGFVYKLMNIQSMGNSVSVRPRIVAMLGLSTLLAWSVLAGAAEPAKAPTEADLASVGSRIYRHGMLLSGQDLIGQTAGDVKLAGADAACIKCHRRSGLGTS